MKIRYHYFLAVLPMLVFGACSDNDGLSGKWEDDFTPADASRVTVYFAASEGEEGGSLTRTMLDANMKVSWQKTDKIGISAIPRVINKTTVVNKMYNPVNDGVSSAFQVPGYWPEMELDGVKYDFYSYYPHTSSDISGDGKTVTLTIKNQEQSEANNYDHICAKDFLYANLMNATVSSGASPRFSFTYRHALTMLRFTVKNLNGKKVTRIALYDPDAKIPFVGTFQVNLATGKLKQDEQVVSDYVLSLALRTPLENENDQAWMLLAPLPAATKLEVYVMTDDMSIYQLPESAFSFPGGLAAGKCNDVTIDMNTTTAYPVPTKDTDASYLLGSENNLMWLAKLTNIWGDAASARLNSDIHLTPTTNWEPIGNTNSAVYSGTFDGAGHTIYDLTFNDANKELVGLIGLLRGAVKNVHLQDVNIVAKGSVGGIAGYCGGSVSGCFVEGSIKGEASVGGTVGRLSGNSAVLENCYSAATVEATAEVGNLGGIVGTAEWGSAVKYCYSIGDVIGLDYVGGICGVVVYGSSITGCIALNKTLRSNATAMPQHVHRILGHGEVNSLVNCAAYEKIADGLPWNNDLDGTSLTVDEYLTSTTYTSRGWSTEAWGFTPDGTTPGQSFLPWNKLYGDRVGTEGYEVWKIPVK